MAKRRRSAAWTTVRWALALSGWVIAALLWHFRGEASRDEPVRDHPAVAAVLAAASVEPGCSGAALAFCAIDEDGHVIYESPLARTALAPASALKTLTTGAALEVLGPEFRFETALRSEADDLVLVGSGDPTLSFADLEALAEKAVAAGLEAVPGELRADISI